jgi:NADH dehydrogenase [ubiquinone] 1 alpha subcomplex assembly factor 7
MQRDVFGREGDFTTAPEISQMFGELIGIWFVSMWLSMGSPSAVRLVEMGPGRGTLMSDLLRAARSFPSFLSAVQAGGVHLVEVSPALRDIQRKKLGATPQPKDGNTHFFETKQDAEGDSEWKVSCGDTGIDLTAQWHEGLDQVPSDMPLLMVGQEILDAFPIHQFEYVSTTDNSKGSWRERMVDLNSALPPHMLTSGIDVGIDGGSSGSSGTSGTSVDGSSGGSTPAVAGDTNKEQKEDQDQEHYLRFVLSQGPTPASMAFAGTGTDGSSAIRSRWARQSLPGAGGGGGGVVAAGADGVEVGERIEVCPQALALAEELTDRLKEHGGAALLIDYGYGHGGDGRYGG